MVESPYKLSWIAVLSACISFVGLQALAFAYAGVFEYPLDDVYIHLAMAEGISQGTYGVNPGVAASAASSILWPLLVLPFPGTEFQRMLPLVWNVVALLGCAWLWGRAVALGGYPKLWALALAVLGPVALNMPGVAFVGMENAFHAFVSMVVLFGLWQFTASGRISVWFALALILSPLIRLEGLALSLAAIGIIALRGQLTAALLLAAGIVLPVVAFAGFLTSLGLDPLPGSVLAKMQLVGRDLGLVERIFETLLRNLVTLPGQLLGVLTVVAAVLPLISPVLRKAPAGPVLLALTAAGAAHMLFAQIGWMHRYEHYMVLTLVTGLVLVGGELVRSGAGRGTLVHVLVSVAIAVAALGYWPKLLGDYAWNPRAIHLQQAQTARFAKEFLQAPVAVNDLGWAAWNNENFVLDLWGLGSEEVRHILFAPVPPANGWADPLVKAHNVRAAMIYDSWFAPAVGPDWVRMGEMTMDGHFGKIGDWTVSFYATDPASVDDLRAAMVAFAPTLPPDAHMTLTEAGQ